jgi:hypothetical protein
MCIVNAVNKVVELLILQGILYEFNTFSVRVFSPGIRVNIHTGICTARSNYFHVINDFLP